MTSVVSSGGRTTEERIVHTWWFGYLAVVGCGLILTVLTRRQVRTPFIGVSLALLMLLLVCWLIRPRATLYAMLALTAISDTVTTSWFPFVKNLSSRESIAFLADAATVSPLDLTLTVGFVVSVVRRYAHTRTFVVSNPLTRPVVAFTILAAYGVLRGLMAGADPRIVVLVSRPFFYILPMFVIATNECRNRRHFREALGALVVGVVVQSLLSIQYVSKLDAFERDSLESLNEHGSALGHNMVIVVLLGLVLLGVRQPIAKSALVVGFVPVGYVYFIAQRRAAVAALLIAGIMFVAVLFWRRRRTFWLATPLGGLLLTVYVAAFWNSTSTAGFPAQAVKALIAPGQATAEDQSSDSYRYVEALDLNFTIRTDPIKGLGFGRAFYRPYQLPDISFFELNGFQPHNSILLVWIAMGFAGFVSMLYLLAKSLMVAAERLRSEAVDVDLIAVLAAASFVAMYAVYTYVDVSWDPRNTLFLALALAIIGAAGQGGKRGTARDEVVDATDRTTSESLST